MDASLTLPLLIEPEKEGEEIVENETVNKKVLNFIYAAHFLARWGAGMWDFNVSLFMISIWPESLLLTAIYGLVEALSIAVLGVYVGEWLDNTTHIMVIRISVAVRNGSVLLAALLMIYLLLRRSTTLHVFLSIIAVIDIFGTTRSLAEVACNILLERDWVVNISAKRPDLLVEMNSMMKRIDLACKLLAPVFVGALMSSVSILFCVILIAGWNLISLGAEYYLLHFAVSNVPELSTSKRTHHEELVEDKQNKKFGLMQGWLVYFKQQTASAAVALALLYFTILSFGTLMTAALKWKGVPAFVIGLARGMSACVGVGTTFVYPKMHAYLQTVRTGLWSIWIQWSCLLLCVASVFVKKKIYSSAILITGVILSRFGLWSFDLAVTQLMQSSVPESERGVIGGVQNSLQSFMQMISFVMAMIVSRPQDFGDLVFVSFGSVTTAALLYSIYTYNVRGHLFHCNKMLKWL